MNGSHPLLVPRCRAAACLTLLIVLPSYGQFPAKEKAISQYVHQVWQAEDGLPQNTVNAVVQTSDGYLWAGTQEGLVRFDGIRFSVYDRSNIPGLKSHYIWELYEDRAGRLWAGTNGGGVLVHEAGTFRILTEKDGLADDVVNAVYQTRDGRIWIGTAAGLNYVEDGRILPFSRCSVGGVSSVREDGSGKLWAGTRHGLIDLSTCRVYTHSDGLSGSSITDLHLDSKGRLWVATTGGLSRIEDGRIETNAGGPDLVERTVLSVRDDRQGSIWAGTGGDGIYRIRGEEIVSYTTKDGLSDNFVPSIWEDSEGSLWFGTYSGGLNRLREGSFTTFTSKEGLSDDFVLSVFEASDRRLLIGTYGGGLNVVEDGRVTVYGKNEGLRTNVVSAVTQSRDGAVWLGLFGAGLARMQGGIVGVLTVDDGLPDTNINAVHEPSTEPGAIWIATDNGVARYDGGKFTTWTAADGLAHDRVTGIFDDPIHGLWFATDGGLSYFDGTHFRNYTTADGLSTNAVLALHWDGDGVLWIGTDGGGLNRFDGRTFTSFTMSDGPFDDVAFAVLEDDRGTLWMSSNAGIYSASRQALDAYAAGRIPSIPSTSYGPADGMKSSECNGRRQPSAWKGADGRLWFATIRGVVAVDPETLNQNTTPPTVKIESVLADAEAPSLDRPIVLDPETGRIEFHYTAPSYLDPESISFKYRLDGFDREWIVGGTDRSASYTNLPPGSYTFHVLAAGDEGRWSDDEASVQFVVKPHFYQTTWFAALSVIWVLALVFLAYKIRIRNLERRTHELEAVVSIRTREISRQKEMAEQANRVKSRLLSIAAHDLKNPLNGVRGFSQSIASEAAEGMVTEMASHIFDASQRMLRLIDDLLESAALDMDEMRLDIQDVDLSLLAERVADEYRPVAEHKRQLMMVSTADECIVTGDERRLYAVLENLVSNAVKYSPHGKRIWLDVERGYDTVRVTIRDEGPGFSEEDLGRAFSPFQKLSALPTGNESSTGLGLSIAKQIVDLHRGRIEVASNQGVGSTFTVELPAAEAELRRAVA